MDKPWHINCISKRSSQFRWGPGHFSVPLGTGTLFFLPCSQSDCWAKTSHKTQAQVEDGQVLAHSLYFQEKQSVPLGTGTLFSSAGDRDTFLPLQSELLLG